MSIILNPEIKINTVVTFITHIFASNFATPSTNVTKLIHASHFHTESTNKSFITCKTCSNSAEVCLVPTCIDEHFLMTCFTSVLWIMVDRIEVLRTAYLHADACPVKLVTEPWNSVTLVYIFPVSLRC